MKPRIRARKVWTGLEDLELWWAVEYPSGGGFARRTFAEAAAEAKRRYNQGVALESNPAARSPSPAPVEPSVLFYLPLDVRCTCTRCVNAHIHV